MLSSGTPRSIDLAALGNGGLLCLLPGSGCLSLARIVVLACLRDTKDIVSSIEISRSGVLPLRSEEVASSVSDFKGN